MSKKPTLVKSSVTDILKTKASIFPVKSRKGEIPYIKGHGKVADQVHEAYQLAVDAEQANRAAQAKLIEVARPLYEQKAKVGAFSKSLNFEGETTAGIQVTWRDQFKDLSVDMEKELRTAMGSKFDHYFEIRRDLKLQDPSDEVIAKLMKLLGEDEFFKLFQVKQVIRTKSDMDRNQFGLPEEVRNLLEQFAPALKPVKE